MSMITTYQLISRIDLATVPDLPSQQEDPLSMAWAATQYVTRSALRSSSRSPGKKRSDELVGHLLNVGSWYRKHLEASFNELGYQPEGGPVTWSDHNGLDHQIEKVWRGPNGVIGLTRLPSNRLLAYTRSPSEQADLQRIVGRFAVRLMAVYFRQVAAKTFELPTLDGSVIPTRVHLQGERGLRLEAEILNPRRDDCCISAMALISELFGTPLHQEYSPG